MRRKMSKKKLIAIASLAIIAVAALVGIASPPATGAGIGLGARDSVFVIRLSGSIEEGGSPSLLGGGGIHPRFIRKRLRQARESSSIKAVVLWMNTGGGTVAASQEIAAIVKEFDKPVVVSMGDVTASGGYYIASQADVIVAHPTSLTGSIGVIWMIPDIEGLLEKIGVTLDAVTTGKHKDMFLPGRLTPERREIIQEIADQAYGQFVGAVAEARGLPEPQVTELATGQLYTGEQALALGLVDVLGGLEEAIDQAEKLAGIEDARVVEFTPSFFEQLAAGPGLGEIRGMLTSFLIGEDIALLREYLNGATVPRYGR